MEASPLGATLAEFAAARRTSTPAARAAYAGALRLDAGLPLPRITRREHHDEVLKFCLEVPSLGGGPSLETESVIIPMSSYRGSAWSTLCVSSQVGCRMGCTFCETGRMGLLRQLTGAEIVRQRLVARQLMLQEQTVARRRYRYFDDGIRNIVFMGMGEPLDNLDAVVQAIRVFNDPRGMDVPLSQITVSTVGRVDGLRKLAALNWPNLRIAVSLNAPNDRLRDQLMPINKGMPLADLQRCLVEYPLARKGLFLVEYVLIRDVNDGLEHADQVAEWCRPLRCVVNLIPYNPQRDARFTTPQEDTVLRFLARLRLRGIFVKRRVTQGRRLMGACGQLGNPEVSRGSRGATQVGSAVP